MSGARAGGEDIADALRGAWIDAGRPGRVLLAVSGGGDSMGMLASARALAHENAAVLVATVDHGLRPESAAEAARVAKASAALGFQHETLVWRGEKPASGLQEAAREARYGLLYAAAARLGAGALVTAHTADDLAETFVMRLARGSGAQGLAAMARPVKIAVGAGAPLELLRPFLRVRRAVMRAIAQTAGLPITDDPSNDDVRYERIRARRFLADAGRGLGISIDAIVRSAEHLAVAAAAERRLAAVRADTWRVRHGPFGEVSCEPAAVSPDTDALMVARLVHSVSGAAHPPDAGAAMTALDDALGGRKASIGGVILAPREAGDAGLLIYREPAAVLGRAGVPAIEPMRLGPGERILWDRRFIVENVLKTPATLSALGAIRPAEGVVRPEEAMAAPALVTDNGDVTTPLDAPEAFQNLGGERFNGGVIRFDAPLEAG
ncbi:MAG: tRNA lysidine(34) synthetase TilS [Pseudomonadota bacterium]